MGNITEGSMWIIKITHVVVVNGSLLGPIIYAQAFEKRKHLPLYLQTNLISNRSKSFEDMAITNASLHIRSISLPSASHPIETNAEDHLRRLRASQAGPSSSSSICQNLFSIKDLYEQMNDLICLPHNQKHLTKGKVEEVLEGSLALLDASSSALDALSNMKEYVLHLQSSLRRGSIEEGIDAYLVSRKKIIKIVSKCLADMKRAEKKETSLEDEAITGRMLKQAEAISLLTLKSVLSFVMGEKGTSKKHNWSLVAKLVQPKNATTKSDEATEVDEVDMSVSGKPKGVETKSLLKKLETLEMVIHELEDGLESVSRCFVKSRVSILNVLNN